MKQNQEKQTAVTKSIPKTTKGILALTGNKIKSFNQEGKELIFKTAFDLLTQEEANGQTDRANNLRKKIEQICQFVDIVGGAESVRRQDWIINHSKIISCIRNHIIGEDYFNIPSINTISEKTKLSRQTVHDHLSQGMTNEFHKEKLKHLEYLSTDVLGKLYKMAITGNVAAGKVFLENVYKPAQAPTANIKQQNNYVQVNNTLIDEVIINNLPAAARMQIEEIIKQNNS